MFSLVNLFISFGFQSFILDDFDNKTLLGLSKFGLFKLLKISIFSRFSISSLKLSSLTLVFNRLRVVKKVFESSGELSACEPPVVVVAFSFSFLLDLFTQNMQRQSNAELFVELRLNLLVLDDSALDTLDKYSLLQLKSWFILRLLFAKFKLLITNGRLFVTMIGLLIFGLAFELLRPF